MNVEHELSERTVLSLGLGSSILAGTAYALGLRFYPDPKQSGLRYSVLYATNAVITDDEPCNSFIPIPFCGEESAHEGLNLALGWSGRSPSNGWDFDLVAIVFSQAWERIEDLEDRGRDIDGDTGPSLKISFGYHWY